MTITAGTFARPRLLRTAPGSVIDQVGGALGGPIVGEEPAAAGFTESVASVVAAASGATVFVKAGPVSDGSADAVRAGAELAAVIGDLGPPLLSLIEADGWVAAVYAVVPGRAIVDWETGDLPRLAEFSERFAARLDPAPIPGTEPYARAFAPLLGTWQALAARNATAEESAAGGAATAAAGIAAGAEMAAVEHVRQLALPYGLHVEILAELEADWHAQLEVGTALQHGDIRRDNVVREPSGRLWLVDWTHRWTAPGWADWVRLAPDVAASGFDPEAVLQGSAWADADAHAVNVMLAGLAGRCWRDGHRPDVPGLPQLRPMQLLQGDMTLRWLARRIRPAVR
jgi:hypothetical protein